MPIVLMVLNAHWACHLKGRWKKIKMNYRKVSIIILNWNGLDDTIECLESLKKITYPNYEVIVVDNASSGNDLEVLRERYGDYILIIANDENYGYPEGNNIGMRYALNKGVEYVLLLNNDTIVDPDFLSELVKVAESDSSAGIMGSKVQYYYHPNTIQAAGGKIRWWLGVIKTYGGMDMGQYEEIAERDFVYATSALIKREVTEKIGLLDPFFFFGVEEFDYCTRAKRAGFKIIYVPKSKIWHKAGASKAKLAEHPEALNLILKKGGFLNCRYYFVLFRKHVPPPLFIIAFLGYIVATFLKALFSIIVHRDIQAVKRVIRKYVLREIF